MVSPGAALDPCSAKESCGSFEVAGIAQDLADFLSASLSCAACLDSLRPWSSGAGDIHLSAPVRLFFEWDPLIALTNALAGHALYRGLLWCLVILVPTLFLGRFFCGWICPMGTLQHWVGNMPSESKRGKQRIESNRYKRWQTVKYVVLIAGLIAAVFGSMAIGWLDPFSLLVRSIGLAILPAFNFAVRAVLTPLEHSHVARDPRDQANLCTRSSRPWSLTFARPTFRRGWS